VAEKEIKTVKGLFEEAWRIYRRGRHLKEPPREEGCYAVWGRDSIFRGYIDVFHGAGEVWYSYRGRVSNNPARVHVGWWWSRPVPYLPPAPDWDAEVYIDGENEDPRKRARAVALVEAAGA
jgi:hypothetical protein